MKALTILHHQIAALDDAVDHSLTSSAVRRLALIVMRSAAVIFFSFCALAEIGLIIPFVRRDGRASARAAWLHDWCRFACRVLGVRTNVHGIIPRRGLLVCNHLSYLDILVISATTPCVFVAKRDVRSWPLFGWLAKAAGAIFVDRRRKTDAARIGSLIRDAVNGHNLVVLFPEGTSSDGSTVLPFKSALLEPALELDARITAGAIDYRLRDGSVGDEVCYWRDMTLVPHLLNLFGKSVIEGNLAFARVHNSSRNRKVVAQKIRDEIITMRL
jgi:1-acyl-sn-glycerol-3-phosphate acyltransferase